MLLEFIATDTVATHSFVFSIARPGFAYIPAWLSEAGATRGRACFSPFPGRPKRRELSPGRALGIPIAFSAAGTPIFWRGDESGSSIDANDCAAGDRVMSLLSENYDGGGGGGGAGGGVGGGGKGLGHR